MLSILLPFCFTPTVRRAASNRRHNAALTAVAEAPRSPHTVPCAAATPWAVQLERRVPASVYLAALELGALGAALRMTGALTDEQADDYAEKFEIAYSDFIPDEEQPILVQTGFLLKKQQVSFKSVSALSKSFPKLKTTKELSWLTLSSGVSCASLPNLKTAVHADVLRHLKASEPPMALLCFRGAGEKPSGALLAVLDAGRAVQGYVVCKQCPHTVWAKMFA